MMRWRNLFHPCQNVNPLHVAMLKRAVSQLSTGSGQSSESCVGSKNSSKVARKPSLTSLEVGTPLVRLGLGKVAKGQPATLVSEICKAASAESGPGNVKAGFS